LFDVLRHHLPRYYTRHLRTSCAKFLHSAITHCCVIMFVCLNYHRSDNSVLNIFKTCVSKTFNELLSAFQIFKERFDY